MSSTAQADIEGVVKSVLERYPHEPASLIGVLQDIQAELRYLPQEGLEAVAQVLGAPLSRVYHVVTFFKAFSLAPKGKHVIKVCLGTACHVRGSPRILEELCRRLEVAPGETTGDGEFTVETVNCVGACALGPVLVIDEVCHSASLANLDKLLKAARKGRPAATARAAPAFPAPSPAELAAIKAKGVVITVCGGTGCHAYGCQAVFEAFQQQIRSAGLADVIGLLQTGCHGFCERGPLVVLRPQNIFYQKVAPEDAEEIVRQTALEGEVIQRLLYRDPRTRKPLESEGEVPFYAGQQRLVFGDNGVISPVSIEDYLARGGYKALRKALAMRPDQIIEEVKKSGLRGRGGGGFPTGRKWETCRRAHGEPKYVICNADEGDPGAYMDRSLLEGNPHRVLEGMIIGAFAIGSHEGYVYVRDEYPLAVKHIRFALDAAREKGYLGRDILGSGFAFDVKVVRGGGAFVCGESTALMASLEGKPGEPRAKYIHTVESGLWEKPSNLNNVETWANVPLIIERGGDWFAGIGTGNSKGTKIFSLVGKVINTGLVEVPMGTTLRQIVFDIGGGVPAGRRFKAVQTGGPSGGCIPAQFLDTPVDFDRLTELGSMMGSGGMIVMDDRTCMVDVARYFMAFLREESCGKCVPCREGLARMSEILERICAGDGRADDMPLLQELSETMADASLCALGTSAPNPVLTTLKYFEDEYRAHIFERRCPAGVCKPLITFVILADKCTGCMACKKVCPVRAISGERKQPHQIDAAACTRCGACFDVCRFDVIMVK